MPEVFIKIVQWLINKIIKVTQNQIPLVGGSVDTSLK